MRVPKKRKSYDVKNIIIWIFMIIVFVRHGLILYVH
jgi:hypothetical protein